MASPSPAVLLEYSSRIKEELDKLESFEITLFRSNTR